MAAMAVVAGCSDRPPTVIDGSSPEAFRRTTVQARRDLSDADRLVFDRALKTIGGRRYSAKDPATLARVTFNGMTGAQVVEDQRARD